jgi:competence protein ComEC
MLRSSALLGLATWVLVVPARAQEIPEGSVFVASVRGRVYYWVECSSWRSLNEDNLVFFETRADATQAGYRPSTRAGCAGPFDGAVSTTDPLVARVVDVGPGLCTVTEIPAADRSHFIVYDAGHWTGSRCLDAVREIVGARSIDLLVISHSDSDHLGDAAEILDEFLVESVLTTGFERSTGSWRDMRDALSRREAAGADVQRLTEEPLTPGETRAVGDATVTLVAGWPEWTLTSGPTSAELRNAVSIVIRVEYAGSSILYAGDTVGKRLDDPDSACKDAEMVMVSRHEAQEVSLAADALIAPHHGGNNASSSCFIEAVRPSAVVFSAGHDHGHPTTEAALRYQAAGVEPDSLFRTDRGDDEDEASHWEPDGTVDGCVDPRGDDDVEIRIAATGSMTVRYTDPSTGCGR